MKRLVVRTLAKVDEGLDEVLYRPAVVKAFVWLPRWWLCDLARLSIALDKRWGTGWWDDNKTWPGKPCQACGRRASIHVHGGLDADEIPTGVFVESHPVLLCGWCELHGPLLDENDLQRELQQAGHRSVAWRWRRSLSA